MKIDDDFFDLNEYGVLRINAEIWVSVFFLCRYFFLFLMLIATYVVGQGHQMAFVSGLLNPYFIFAELPALLFLMACFYRRTNVNYLWVKAWQAGSWLVLTSAVLHIIATIFNIWSDFYLDKSTVVLLCLTGIDILIVNHFLFNRRVGLILAEHPAVIRCK